MEYWDNTLTKSVEELKREVEELGGAACTDASDAHQKLAECDRKVAQIKKAKNSYLSECRILEDPAEEIHYKTKLRHMDEQVIAAQERMAHFRRDLESQELLADHRAENNEASNNDEYLSKIEGKLDDIKESYQRDEVYLEEIKVVGSEAVTKLRGQREQIIEITEKTQEIDNLLHRADILIRNFGRRMATDRLIQIFAMINILLLVGVVIYAIVSGANLSDGVQDKNNIPDASNA
mmetsp:Transcript_19454/g.25113  ORF Transcript_19454/g.25113 Transcript_19454/m.25113 type:complete len:236 (+) Transcript_19454:177-884(+)